MTKKRIEYFDLAKGVCILLVVWYHLKQQYQLVLPTDVYTHMLRMPFYFFLSGFFFKTYEGFLSFVRKKTMKLLVPFSFFYLTTSVLLPIVMSRLMGVNFENGNDWHLLYAFLTYQEFPNFPIWFLWALFILNVCFYILRQNLRRNWLLGLVCLMLTAFVGAYLDLPASISKAFGGLLAFYCGYMVHKLDLVERFNSWWIIVASLLLFVVLGALLPDSGAPLFVVFQLGALSGITFLILLCRRVKHLPYVSYLGRYSIMVLVTHELIMRMCVMLHISNIFLAFLIIILSYLAIIPFMKRFMPWVTAQK